MRMSLKINYFFFFFAVLIAIATACFCFAFAGVIPSLFAMVAIAFARVFQGFSCTSFEMFLEIEDFHLERGIFS